MNWFLKSKLYLISFMSQNRLHSYSLLTNLIYLTHNTKEIFLKLSFLNVQNYHREKGKSKIDDIENIYIKEKGNATIDVREVTVG